MFLLGFLQQFVLLGRRFPIAHLGLQVLNLLLQKVVALLFVKVLTRLVAYIGLQMLQVNLAVQHFHRGKQTLLDGFRLKQRHLLLDAERHVRAGEVQRHHVVVDILYSERRFVGNIIAHVDILVHLLAQVLHRRAEFLVALLGLYLRGLFHVSGQVGLVADNVNQPQASQRLNDSRYVAVGQCELLDHLGIDAILEEVF